MLVIPALTATLALLGCAAQQAAAKEEAVQASEASPPRKLQWGIVIHGSAGVIRRDTLTPEKELLYRAKLTEALRAGHAVLARGGSSLDAVGAALRILEDSPLFNAGHGAVFNHDGQNELDAAIMEARRT